MGLRSWPLDGVNGRQNQGQRGQELTGQDDWVGGHVTRFADNNNPGGKGGGGGGGGRGACVLMWR